VGERLVKSASRAFAVIELFARVRAPLRLKDVAAGLGHPVSSAAALLKTMTQQGYLAFDPKSRAYMPTARLPRLVNWISYDDFEEGVVAEAMQQLWAQSHEGVVLGTPVGIHLEYVRSLRGVSEGVQFSIPTGTRRVLIQTGMGWQFLSLRPQAEALDVYRQTIAAGALDRASFPVERFLQQLESHRHLEITLSRARDLVAPTAHWDGAMASILIDTPPGHRPLALGIPGPTDRLERHLPEISAHLRAAAQHIRVAIRAS
jgi:DNA-binding IclR family transcriptional regulator